MFIWWVLAQRDHLSVCHTHFVWRRPMTTKRCVCCGQNFLPRPKAPNQPYCSLPDCQRARKRQWHQRKLKSDPEYRDNQRDAQRAWLDRHPDYWLNYRNTHRESAEPNRDRRIDPKAGNASLPLKRWTRLSHCRLHQDCTGSHRQLR